MVESDLDCTSWVNRSMPSHCPTRRLVRPDSSSGVVERTDLIGCSVQNSVVIRGHMPEWCKGPTINQSVCFYANNPSFSICVKIHFYPRWVAAPVNPVYLFSIERYSNWPPRFSSQNCGTHFMRKWVRFSSEATTYKCPVYVYLMHRDF